MKFVGAFTKLFNYGDNANFCLRIPPTVGRKIPALRLVEYVLFRGDFVSILSTAVGDIIRKEIFANSLTSGAMRVKITDETGKPALFLQGNAARFALTHKKYEEVDKALLFVL